MFSTKSDINQDVQKMARPEITDLGSREIELTL